MIDKDTWKKYPSSLIKGMSYPRNILVSNNSKIRSPIFGEIFTDPVSIFPEEMLKPELQDRVSMQTVYSI